ncbi:ANTAR domain-containing protein [Pseudarthrobacter sp. NPDC092439]|uniref:ANTAR domain-containing protein n=1 Tax=unclassified Pseudarthrobacter TaxID=2647000 RepID=UPI003817C9BB
MDNRGAETDLTLQGMVLANPDIRSFLTELAVLASGRLSSPGNPVHSGVTVLRRKRPEAVAASDATARALDELQNGFGDGPCLTALRTRSTVMTPDLAAEDRWSDYVRAALRNGVASILAVPLDLAGEADAVLNIYAQTRHSFPSDSIATVEAFAEQAAGALRLSLRISQLSEAREDLTAALQSRTMIDTALGVIMAENRCSRDTAFSILTRASSARNIKVRDLAATVIASVSGEEKIDTHFDE